MVDESLELGLNREAHKPIVAALLLAITFGDVTRLHREEVAELDFAALRGGSRGGCREDVEEMNQSIKPKCRSKSSAATSVAPQRDLWMPAKRC